MFPEVTDRRPYELEQRARADLGSIPPPPPPGFAGLSPLNQLICERTRFNADRSHRFTLYRQWGEQSRYVACVGMNPSGAQENLTDVTVRKLCTYADRHWGMGALYMLNALSIRCTDSTKLPAQSIANLPENDEWIRQIVRGAQLVVVCWGNPGHEHGRGKAVEAILRAECDPGIVKCFGRNGSRAPTHPLLLPFSQKLIPYFDDVV